MSGKTLIAAGMAQRDQAVQTASAALNDGHVIAIPTETVYGLAARADRPDAVARLRQLKGRAAGQALTVHVARRDDAEDFAGPITGPARRIMRKGWPGPITLIFDVPDDIHNDRVQRWGAETAGAIYHEGTVGIRCPDNHVTTGILGSTQGPVVASSANAAGQPPACDAPTVADLFGDQLAVIVDDGPARHGKSSTVVRVRADGVDILREGVCEQRTIERLATLRILFVCSGNTCRSPMAKALAEMILARRLGIQPNELASRYIRIESAGTFGGGGGATPHAANVMRKRGLDLSEHVSRSLTVEQIRSADYVFTMTAAHRQTVIQLVRDAADRVHCLLDGEDLVDPFGGDQAVYEDCARRIEDALQHKLGDIPL